jgi:outer membrane lipoprotein SlyB
MTIIQRIQRVSAAAAIVAFAGACAGNSLGNVLGSVLGGGSQGSQSGQLTGTIRSVDTRSQQIAIQQSNGQTVPVYYDNQTQVVYQNQNYSPTALENGDRVTARIQANGNNYYTDYVQVDQSVNGTSAGTSGLQMIQGTVRQVDLRNGWFAIADANSNNTLTVTVPYNLNSNDINRFRSLRNGDFVRFYGQYLNNTQIQLRQFN